MTLEKHVERELLYMLLSVGLLVVLAGFIPSWLLIQPKELTVEGDKVVLVRTVTVPHEAEFLHEFEDMETREHLLSCLRRGRTHYEWRGLSPIVFRHGCEELVKGRQYTMRACWKSEFVFNLSLAQHCKTATFVYHEQKE